MLKKIILFILILLINTFTFAQASEINPTDNNTSVAEEINPKTGFPNNYPKIEVTTFGTSPSIYIFLSPFNFLFI